jgi:predicted ester cyclase
MASRNVETFRTAHDGFNSRDFDKVIGLFTDSFEYTDQPRGVTHDKQQFKDSFMQGWVNAFSDARVAEAEYIDGGDVVVARFVGKGTNDGSIEGAPPTGRTMSLPFVEIMRFDSQGRMTGGEAIYDQVTIMTQLGLMPAPTGA